MTGSFLADFATSLSQTARANDQPIIRIMRSAWQTDFISL